MTALQISQKEFYHEHGYVIIPNAVPQTNLDAAVAAISKFLGIQYCLSMIINQSDQWINLFTTSKKKDDLSDAYLQGIYWLIKES